MELRKMKFSDLFIGNKFYYYSDGTALYIKTCSKSAQSVCGSSIDVTDPNFCVYVLDYCKVKLSDFDAVTTDKQKVKFSEIPIGSNFRLGCSEFRRTGECHAEGLSSDFVTLAGIGLLDFLVDPVEIKNMYSEFYGKYVKYEGFSNVFLWSEEAANRKNRGPYAVLLVSFEEAANYFYAKIKEQ